MISNIEDQILTLFYTMALAYFIGIIAMYYEKETVFSNTDETESDTDEELLVEQVKEPIKYQDKYLERYRSLNDKFVYSYDDYEVENQKYEELIFTNHTKLENGELTLEDIQKESCEYMHNQFLLKLNNSYAMENTPLGNVAMCYNHEKETFEYYSDKVIPYRYLEPVARKYVIFFHCKQLYVDMDEELKQSELKSQQDKAAKEEADKIEKEQIETNKNDVPKKELFAKLKHYNKETTNGPSNFKNNKPSPLPNYMKPTVVQSQSQRHSSSNILLKEHANRYTHSGRFSNFMILKTVNRNVVDKKYALSYKDYKMISK